MIAETRRRSRFRRRRVCLSSLLSVRRGGDGNLLGDHFQNLDCFFGGHFQKRNRALLWGSFHEKWYKETVSCNMGSLYKNWDEVGGRFENLLSFRKMVGSPPLTGNKRQAPKFL